MFWRRLGYLLALAGSLIFYWAYREWLSGLLLAFVLALPWFSLLISLPSMLMVRLELQCPDGAEIGQECPLRWRIRCPLPVAGIKSRLRLKNLQTGQLLKQRRQHTVDVNHCGGWELTPYRAWVRDYLGLFSLPIWKKQGKTVRIRPKSVVMENPPDVQRYLAGAFRPKAGGGFAEQHELRLYRPGDQLRQVHWKLSAKSGKLVIREPMEPIRGRALVTLELSGTPEQLDRKLGKLLWLSNWLLEQEIPHQIQCLTGSGMQTLEVTCPEDVPRAIDTLLLCPASQPGQRAVFSPASWLCHIGGDDDEG